MKKIKTLIENLGMPNWGYINNVELDGNSIVITYCDSYHITISRDGSFNDCISAEGDIAWGKADVEFAINVLNSRDEIIEMV